MTRHTHTHTHDQNIFCIVAVYVLNCFFYFALWLSVCRICVIPLTRYFNILTHRQICIRYAIAMLTTYINNFSTYSWKKKSYTVEVHVLHHDDRGGVTTFLLYVYRFLAIAIVELLPCCLFLCCCCCCFCYIASFFFHFTFHLCIWTTAISSFVCVSLSKLLFLLSTLPLPLLLLLLFPFSCCRRKFRYHAERICHSIWL